MDKDPEVMTIDQAAKFLQLHYQTVWTLVKEKKIPAKKIGRVWRILKKDIIAYLENQN